MSIIGEQLQGEHQVAKSNTHPTEWQLWSARARQRFPGVLPGLHYHLYNGLGESLINKVSRELVSREL